MITQLLISLILMLSVLCGYLFKKWRAEVKIRNANQKCKRDFISMYKSIITDISILKQRNKDLSETLNKYANGIR